MGFVGSEDYIRLQFEEYALSMVSSVKCHDFLQKHTGSAGKLLPDVGSSHNWSFAGAIADYKQRGTPPLILEWTSLICGRRRKIIEYFKNSRVKFTPLEGRRIFINH